MQDRNIVIQVVSFNVRMMVVSIGDFNVLLPGSRST
jgi:hypothetical protein